MGSNRKPGEPEELAAALHEPCAAIADIPTPQSSAKRLVAGDELKRLRQPVRWRLVRDLGAVWLQILFGVALYVAWPNPVNFVAAFVLIAGGQHGLMLVTHEFSHYAVVPDDRTWNDRLGKLFFGDPVVIPLELFRYRHFAHHRTYSTDDDTKSIYKRSLKGAELWRQLLRSMSGFEFVAHLFEASDRNISDAGAGQSPPSAIDALKTLLPVHLAIFGLFCLVDWKLYFLLWALPIVTLANVFGMLRAMMEHRPLDEDAGVAPGSGYYRDTPGPFVRSVTAGPFERLFLSKINFGYHAEHHLWPQVSYQYLPELRRRLVDASSFDDPRYGLERSYLSTIHKLWKPEPPKQDAMTLDLQLDRGMTSNIAKCDVPTCPACGSSERHPVFSVCEHEYTTTTDDRFTLKDCDGCGAWYLDPRPDKSALDVIYPPNYYAYVMDAKLQQDSDERAQRGMFSQFGALLFKRRIAPIAKHIELTASSSWLDVGCGSGYVLESMRDAYGIVGTGLDLSDQAARFCRARGFEAFASRFEDYTPRDGEQYDLIHSSHVIEHVESPLEYMRKAYDLLKPGGLNVFITPNTASAEVAHFGADWGGLHVPRHWTLLDPESAKTLGERTGFEHVETSFSTNGTFWTWSFHSRYRGRLPERWNDRLFPSDHRFIESGLWNVARIGLFTVFDIAILLGSKQSANMLCIFRKPA